MEEGTGGPVGGYWGRECESLQGCVAKVPCWGEGCSVGKVLAAHAEGRELDPVLEEAGHGGVHL